MSRVNYKKLRKNIPNKVKAKSRIQYEVLWSDEFAFDKEDRKTYGITRFDPRQIVINKNQPDKEAILTLYHEFLHVLSEEYEGALTETQVTKLEQSFQAMREFILTLEGISK